MIGDLVKARRLGLRLTQAQLGERTGLTQDYISKLERGSIDMPQRGTLQVLGRALKIKQAEFFQAAGVMDGEDAEPNPPEQLPLSDLDLPVTRDEAIAYVESRPGTDFQENLVRLREQLSREAYIDFCLQVYRMWAGNSDAMVHLMLREEQRG